MIQMAWRGCMPNSHPGNEQGCSKRGNVGQYEHEYGKYNRKQPCTMGMQAVNNAYQKTSNAISKAIKKTKSS